MIFGMSISTFTLLHVLISLVGITTGLIVLFGLIGGRRRDRWTAVFLASTVAASLTGYAFPIHGLTPAQVVGAISMAALLAAILALYRFHLRGAWRRTYVIAATIALYLNVFVGVAQAFQKVAVLREAAPTQSEPPFAVAQGTVLMLFCALGVLAARNFRAMPNPVASAQGGR